MNFPRQGEAVARCCREPMFGAFGKAHEAGDRHPQFGFGVDLVDVLSTGSAAAGVLEAQMIAGDEDTGREFGCI